MTNSERETLALEVWDEAICQPTDDVGDAQALWLKIAEDASRCLIEHMRSKNGPESFAAVAGTVEAIRRSVMIGRILGEAMHREALQADRQARVRLVI